MLILVLFAFLGGIVTILSTCILPIFADSFDRIIDGSKHRPLGIVTGFILSFTFFILFLNLWSDFAAPDFIELYAFTFG